MAWWKGLRSLGARRGLRSRTSRSLNGFASNIVSACAPGETPVKAVASTDARAPSIFSVLAVSGILLDGGHGGVRG